MLVVSNTSPVMNLAIVGELDLLHQQFGEVIVPPAVIDELRLDTEFPGTDGIRHAMSEGWLRKEHVDNQQIVLAFRRELDNGEAEAIALALQLKADLILMDERDGRLIARSMGLNPIGILGVLIRAKQNREVRSVKEILEKLRAEAGFYISDDLVKSVLSEIGE